LLIKKFVKNITAVQNCNIWLFLQFARWHP